MKAFRLTIAMLMGLGFLGAIGVVASADKEDKKSDGAQEQEREVKEADVPAAALNALKKQAAGAAITEFSEEIEHGHKFYEGSYKSATGNKVDVLVTEAGDLVEVEESTG